MINTNLDKRFVEAHERYLNDAEIHAEISTIELSTTATLENKGYNITDRDRAFIRMGTIFALYYRDMEKNDDPE